jgi:hypothetical protein
MAKKNTLQVIKPNLGLYLDRPIQAVPPGGLQDGLNFRVQLGALNNLNLGWTLWAGANNLPLNGPVKLIESFVNSAGTIALVVGTLTDLYTYNAAGSKFVYITPIYAAGTASASGTAVTGSSTAWNTTPGGSQWANAKAGDQISFGSATQNLTTATWFTIQSVNSATSITLTTSAGSVGSGPYTIRRLFTGSFNNPWRTETFVDANTTGYGNNEDLIYITNGIDNVVNWDGVSAQVNLLTGLGFTCTTLCQFADTMCYLNVTQSGNVLATTMINSDAGAPSNAGLASTGVAAQFIVSGEPNAIVDAYRLGAYMVIYTRQGNIVLVSATGAATIFAFRIAAANKGPVGEGATAPFPSMHQFLALDGMYYFDGSNTQPINTQVFRQVMSTFDHARLNNFLTFLDEANGEQIWSVPQTTDPNSGSTTAPNTLAWTEHYLEIVSGSPLISAATGQNLPHSKRSFPFTAIGNFYNQTVTLWSQLTSQWTTYFYRWSDAFFSANFPIILVGDNSGNLFQLNTSQTGNGAALNSFVTFGRVPLADGRMRALVRRIYPFVQMFPQALTVTAGLSNFGSGPVAITASAQFDQRYINSDLYFAPIYRRGRYLDLTFGDATGNPWVLNGFDIEVIPGGMR